VTIWEWIHQYDAQARSRGDHDAARLAALHGQAYSHRQDDPDLMYALLEEGRLLAGLLGEPWWVVFFEHWQVETLIYYKDDYRDVLDRAVRLTLEVRKPAFDGYPLRFGIHCNLLAAYLCIDPRGYVPAIREALAYLGTVVPPDGGDRYLLLARRHWFAYELAQYKEAERLALEELAVADADPDRHTAVHHEVDTYKALCWIAFKTQEWDKLESSATAGEERARDINYRYELALFLLWRSACARRAGDEESAQRLHRLGTATMSRLGQSPGESYFDALAAYHELGGNLPAAWEVREEEWRTSSGKGQLAYETLIRLKRVKLLRRMDRPLAEEAARARAAAARLRDPSWYLAELERAVG
jgi:hypothetical protein